VVDAIAARFNLLMESVELLPQNATLELRQIEIDDRCGEIDGAETLRT